MRNEGLEAVCRASAAWIERFLSEGAAREAFSSDSPDSGLSDEDWSLLREMLLEQAKSNLEEAERHARMRAKMEPYM